MKVVLFCGGLGTRLREHSETIPKPLVPIGSRPIIWHIMRYYAHYGHKDFILCLGYKGDLIRQYFLDYCPYLTNDFVMTDGGKTLEPQQSDIADWRITFVDTGLHSNIGGRLQAVRHLLDDEPVFLANYSDQLSDLPLPEHIDQSLAADAVAGFVSVRPQQSYHNVLAGADGTVQEIRSMEGSDFWVNGGYFVLKPELFDYFRPGEEMVEEPFGRLIKEGRLWTQHYEGFWRAMDTFKDKITFDRLSGQGNTPWQVWDNQNDES